jgi:hypothetical protein
VAVLVALAIFEESLGFSLFSKVARLAILGGFGHLVALPNDAKQSRLLFFKNISNSQIWSSMTAWPPTTVTL